MIKHQHYLKSLSCKHLCAFRLLGQLKGVRIPECHKVKTEFVELPLPVGEGVKILVCPVVIYYGADVVE